MNARKGMWIAWPVLLLAMNPGSASAQEKASPALAAAIEAVNTQFAQAVKAGDAKGVVALYTDDAVVMPPNTPALTGKAAVEALFGGWFAEMTVTDFALASTEIIPAGTYAIESGTYKMTMKLKNSGEEHTDAGKYIVIWKRAQDGSWRIHRDAWNSDVALPTAQ